MKNPKLICFTTSYRRPYNLYHTINSILNQTYENFIYSIGISVDNQEEQDLYQAILSEFLKDNRLKIFFHTNLDQHSNYLYPLKQIQHTKNNLFAKIDDDDIYKPDYLKKSIELFLKHKCDIISHNIIYQINNNQIYKGLFDNVGGYWHGDLNSDTKFGMPFSYIFNHKCLQVLLNTTTDELRAIHPFEDPGWRTKWREAGIKSYVIDSSDMALYHIHGKNVSSSRWLIDNDYVLFDNTVFTACLCKHPHWESYIIMNKETNVIYNIRNNDLGAYSIENDILVVKWDKYESIEQFKRHKKNNSVFIYEYINI